MLYSSTQKWEELLFGQVGHTAAWPLFHNTAHSREAEGGYSLLSLLIQLPPKSILEINTADAEVRHCTVDAPQYEKKAPYCTSKWTHSKELRSLLFVMPRKGIWVDKSYFLSLTPIDSGCPRFMAQILFACSLWSLNLELS